MSRKSYTLWAIALILISISTACNPKGTPEGSPQGSALREMELETQAALTALASLPTVTVEAATPTTTPESPPTITPTPTSSATMTLAPAPTETPPMIFVTANTNCRSGPGTTYAHKGVLFVGETVEVIARSTLDDYWYILLPEDPSEPCWLSGAYAVVEGDTSILPVYTPMPTPAPPVGFDLYLQGFEACGSTTYVVFSVKNAGISVLKTANVKVTEFETGKSMYGPTFQRFPFAQVVRPVCPPDHGNILNPGVVAYIHVPINLVPHGKTARGEIMLCTGDWLGGDCVTKEIYFLVD